MFCASWYHLYNFKNVENTHGGVLLLVKLQASACNVTKSNTLPWVFFTFFKLYIQMAPNNFNFMVPFYVWGSTASRLQEPMQGGSLLFTIKFPEIPGTHLSDLGRMKS